MSPEALAAATGVSRETSDKFIIYQHLVEKWQKRLNLIGPATLAALPERHFVDSAQLFPLIPESATTLVDLGAGAGFPGLVLALCAADAGRPLAVHLVESDARKAAFLIEAARAVGLLGAAVAVHAKRAQAMTGRFDVVTARALAPLAELCALAAALLAPGGVAIFPKGARHADDVAAARAAGWRFDLAKHPSRTEKSAAILVLRDLARDSAKIGRK